MKTSGRGMVHHWPAAARARGRVARKRGQLHGAAVREPWQFRSRAVRAGHHRAGHRAVRAVRDAVKPHREPVLPIFCPHCLRTIELSIAKLKAGESACPLCGKAIKTTPEFAAMVRTMK
jgi:hypothetical protein